MPGVDAGTVYSEVRIKLSKLDGDLTAVYQRLNKLERTIKDTSDKSTTSFTKMFASIASGQFVADLASKAIRALVSGIKDSIQFSIDAQETFAKYDEVFQGMGSEAEKAAERFADAFDLAGVTAKDMLSNTGNLLQGFGATRSESLAMSEAVNTLAADLASFTNYSGGAKGASEALTKALLGERESAKSLGIAILESDVQAQLAKNGTADLTGEALKLAKAQATLEIITRQAKNSIGDYARTQDSTSNTVKRAGEATKELQVQTGTFLNPTVETAAALWDKVATALADVIAKQNELRGAKEAVEKNTATADQRILVLENEIVELEKRRTLIRQNSYRVGEKLSAEQIKSTTIEIGQKQALIESLQRSKAIEEGIATAKLQADEKAQKDLQAKLEAEEAIRKKYQDQWDLVKKLSDSQMSEYDQIQKDIDSISLAWESGSEQEKIRLETIAALKARQAEIVKKAQDDELTEEEQKAIRLHELKREEYDAFIEYTKKKNEQADADAEKARARKEAELEDINKLYSGASGAATAFGDLVSQLYANQSALIQKQLQDELKANGLAEKSAIEKAQEELQAAKEAGDEKAIFDAENALKKAQIEEKYAKEANELQYQASMIAWGLQLAQTTAASGMAIINAFNAAASTGAAFPVVAPIYQGLAIASGAASIAAVAAAKPVKNFAFGGIAEPEQGGVYARLAENGYGEVAFNTGPTGQEFIAQMAQAIAGSLQGIGGTNIIQVDGQNLAKVITKYQKANAI